MALNLERLAQAEVAGGASGTAARTEARARWQRLVDQDRGENALRQTAERHLDKGSDYSGLITLRK